jgi:hypothetical protein
MTSRGQGTGDAGATTPAAAWSSWLVGRPWPRALVAGGLLVWLAAPAWSEQIDDVYILSTFARQLVQTAELAWHTGERIEGYSSLVWVLVLAACHALQLDVPLWAQLASLGCGLGLLCFASLRLPRDGRGALLLFAIAAWSPYAYWSAQGMETLAFGALAAAGWVLVLERGARAAGGLWLLALAALTRPEGALWYALGGLACVVRGGLPPRAVRVARLSLVAFGAYQLFRVAYFDAFLPTPVLVKAQLGPRGLAQLAVELLSAAGVFAVAFATARPARRDLPFMLAPTALGVAALLGVNGDWMGQGRLLLPGVVASALAVQIHAPARPLRLAPLWLGIALLLGSVESRFLEPPRLRVPTATPLHMYTRGLDTPLPVPLAFWIAHAPPGATVQAADIGIFSQIPDVRVLDSRGLTSGAFAELLRTRDLGPIRALYESEQRPDMIQVAHFVSKGSGPAEAPAGLDPWLRELDPLLARHYPVRDELSFPARGFVGVMREYRRERRDPSPAQRVARLRALHAQFPSQPFFGVELHRALLAAGDAAAATSLARLERRRWPDHPAWSPGSPPRKLERP